MALETEDHFKFFAHALQQNNRVKYGKVVESDLLELQKQQVEELVRLEDEFKSIIINGPYGVELYSKFIKYICDQRKNILDSRPFFRERQKVFTNRISIAFKERDPVALWAFHGNWNLISFMLRARKWNKNSRLVAIGKQIKQIRIQLVEMSLPLAISRARIFYSRTPKSHLSHMDFVQIASEGLLSGVDKFCLPFSKMFRGVCIGRMTGNFIEEFSETLLHFYPNHKRLLYRANKLSGKMSDQYAELDFDRIAEKINSEIEDIKDKTNADEVSRIMAAASVVSVEEQESDCNITKNSNTGIAQYPSPIHIQPDVMVDNAEINAIVGRAIENLSLLERKLLILKGVDFGCYVK